MPPRTENPRSDYLYRKGKYLYFRFPKKFRVKDAPLPADETSLAFERAYDHCLATLRKMEADAAGVPVPVRPIRKIAKAGTIAKAVDIYRASDTFDRLKPKTQRVYVTILDVIKREIGDNELRHLDRDALEDFTGLVFQDGTPTFTDPNQRMHQGSDSMADLYVTVVNNIWKEVRKDEQFGVRKLANPTIEIERRHKDRNAKPHLKWSEEVQDEFVATAPPYLQLAKHVLHFTAQRGGDAVRIKWTHYDGKGIKIWPEKTTAKGAVLDPQYHLLPRPLIKLLDAAKETAQSDFILVNQWGKPWASSNTLSQAIRRHLEAIGVRQKGVKGPSMHGLRHTAGSDVAALPGVGIKGIMSAGGWRSERQAMKYAAQADKERINAHMVATWSDELEAKEKARTAKRRAKRASLKVVK
ncbi:tyrosine-type recombinase/integrase [Bradyrhizobium sp. USDA 10063]